MKTISGKIENFDRKLTKQNKQYATFTVNGTMLGMFKDLPAFNPNGTEADVEYEENGKFNNVKNVFYHKSGKEAELAKIAEKAYNAEMLERKLSDFRPATEAERAIPTTDERLKDILGKMELIATGYTDLAEEVHSVTESQDRLMVRQNEIFNEIQAVKAQQKAFIEFGNAISLEIAKLGKQETHRVVQKAEK